MPKDYRIYLEDMLSAAQRIIALTQNLEFQQFSNDTQKFEAVKYNFVVLGAAARRIPDEQQANHPEVPWRRIIGLRNRIVHEYNGLADETLWDITNKDVIKLQEQLSRLLEQYKDHNN